MGHVTVKGVIHQVNAEEHVTEIWPFLELIILRIYTLGSISWKNQIFAFRGFLLASLKSTYIT